MFIIKNKKNKRSMTILSPNWEFRIILNYKVVRSLNLNQKIIFQQWQAQDKVIDMNKRPKSQSLSIPSKNL